MRLGAQHPRRPARSRVALRLQPLSLLGVVQRAHAAHEGGLELAVLSVDDGLAAVRERQPRRDGGFGQRLKRQMLSVQAVVARAPFQKTLVDGAVHARAVEPHVHAQRRGDLLVDGQHLVLDAGDPPPYFLFQSRREDGHYILVRGLIVAFDHIVVNVCQQRGGEMLHRQYMLCFVACRGRR